MFENNTPAVYLIYSMIIVGSGILLMHLLDKYFSNKDERLDEFNRMIQHSENLSMDEHHSIFQSYYRKKPIGCFFIAGILIVQGIVGVIASIGWYLYQLIFTYL